MLNTKPAAGRHLWRALVVLLTLNLAACASRPGPEVLQTVQALPAASAKQVKVYAVTTRSRVTPDTNVYDNGKSIASNYAELTVSIPPGHKPSQIEWPEKKPDPEKSFAVVGQSVLDQSQFIAGIGAERKASQKIGVFVHGYNNNFQEALFRLAQLSADSDVVGAPILFSWPSQGALSGYVADKEAVTYSRDYLASLLMDLTKGTGKGTGEIYVFGHSMGGWLVVEAIRQLKLQGRDDVLAHLNIVLAAPDIDSDVFGAQMRVIGKLPHPMTVLVSGDDRALAVSKVLSYSTQRVGTLNVNDPLVQQAAIDAGVQLVDISTIEATDSAKHNRFVDAAALYPALTARSERNGLGQAGAFVFDAAAATVSSPFRLVSGALKQGQ
ncbi:MAG: hypothetical protein JWM58_1303 [Rhizobium sp.]|nr:hypothetical protein [Rhizobium sp.]